MLKKLAAIIGLLCFVGNLCADSLLPSDLVYQGAFRVPDGTFGTKTNWSGTPIETFAYSDCVAAYDPAANTLYLTGHIYGQLVAAVSIPTPVKTTIGNSAALPAAAITQPFRDITAGIVMADGTKFPIGFGTGIYQILGMCVDGSRLYWSAGRYYVVDGTSTASQGLSTLLSTAHQAWGPWYVDVAPEQKIARQIIKVPQAWADQYVGGRRLLAGRYTLQGIASTSSGPTLYAYQEPAANLPAKDSVLSGKSVTHWDNWQAPYPGHLIPDDYHSAVWIDTGVKSAVLFVGRKAGASYYGEPRPGDCEQYKGYHGDPYEPRVWFFDPAALGSAAQNNTPESPRAYATWKPAEFWPQCSGYLKGSAYDSARKLLYIVQPYAYKGAGNDYYPIVHVYKVGPDIVVPPPSVAVPLQIVVTVEVTGQDGKPVPATGVKVTKVEVK